MADPASDAIGALTLSVRNDMSAKCWMRARGSATKASQAVRLSANLVQSLRISARHDDLERIAKIRRGVRWKDRHCYVAMRGAYSPPAQPWTHKTIGRSFAVDE
jgi:hypothetical protein